MSKKSPDWQADYESETGETVMEDNGYGCPDCHSDNYVAWLEAKNKSLWNEISKMERRIESTVKIGFRYGGIDGGHHKQWTIDQMLRKLAGKSYKRMVKEYEAGEYGPKTYEWDEGVAP